MFDPWADLRCARPDVDVDASVALSAIYEGATDTCAPMSIRNLHPQQVSCSVRRQISGAVSTSGPMVTTTRGPVPYFSAMHKEIYIG